MKNLNKERKKIDIYDRRIAKTFEKRLEVVKRIGLYKKENNLPVYDEKREIEVINRNKSYVSDEYQELYIDLIKKIMELSKKVE